MATVQSSKHKIKKNAPLHNRGINEIYLDNKQPFNQQLERAWRILQEGSLDHILIHGIGPAMQKVINLALQIKLRGNGIYEVSAATKTIYLHDDLTTIDDSDFSVATSQTRKNSSICVKVFRTLDCKR